MIPNWVAGTVIVMLLIGAGIFQLYIFLYRPDVWEAQQRARLERERQLRQWQMERKEREEARKRNRNQLAVGILGALLKAFFSRR